MSSSFSIDHPEAQEKSSDCELYKQAMSLKPEFKSYAEALADAQQKLEALAAKMNLSVKALLEEVEFSPNFTEDYLEARMLEHRISTCKSQIK